MQGGSAVRLAAAPCVHHSPAMADQALRAMTNDGAFRVITVQTTETVRAVAQAQRVTGEDAARLGELVTGTILLRETMAPMLRSQGILQSSDRRSRIVADSHPDGGARGLLQRPEGATAHFGEGSVLQMMRTMPTGALHQGVVAVPGKGGLSGALMAYLQESEQVASAIAVGCVLEGGEIQSAGGYLVQLLPELSEPLLAVMTARLEDFAPIEQLLRSPTGTPEAMTEELLYLMPYTVLASNELRFQCRCSDVRLLATLATLPRTDIEELLSSGEPLEITCDYCLTEYRLPVERLRGMMAQS